MIRLKVSMRAKKNYPINLNYKYYLAAICNSILNNSSEDFNDRLKKYNQAEDSVKTELLTFTGFFCPQYEVKGSKIIFKDTVNWYISSPIYELILHLVQELFNAGSIRIAKEEFEILGLEAAETPDITVMELNKEIFSLTSNREEEVVEKLARYYMLSEDEKII